MIHSQSNNIKTTICTITFTHILCLNKCHTFYAAGDTFGIFSDTVAIQCFKYFMARQIDELSLALHGIAFQKTHDLDQLIVLAKNNGVELFLPEYLKEKADVISLWETKTRYVIGFRVEQSRIEKALIELEKYFGTLSSIDEL